MANSIQYVNWDGSLWTATLQDVSVEIGIGGIVVAVIDPDFHHVSKDGGGNEHDDKWMHYVADNGQHWACQCHAHNQDDSVSLTFEHFRADNLDDSDHEDHNIRFHTWDGTCRQGTLNRIAMPTQGHGVPVDLSFEVIPCD